MHKTSTIGTIESTCVDANITHHETGPDKEPYLPLLHGIQIGAKEDEMLRWVPNDSIRFDDDSDWLTERTRHFYGLWVRERLGGVIWFGDKSGVSPVGGADWDFAIRMYDSARGFRLARPFMEMTHSHFFDKTGAAAVFLSVEASNHRASGLYWNAGYTGVGVLPGNESRVLMRREREV